jgi:hypothetical protein
MKSYIPKSKSDTIAVEHLKKLDFNLVREDVSKLLECLQDMHWDIAYGIAEYLAPHVNEIKEELLNILSSNDEIWKHGVISFLMAKSPNKLQPELISILKRIAEHPTKSETDDGVDLAAKELTLLLLRIDLKA